MRKPNLLKGVNTAGLQIRLVDAREQVVGRLAAQLAIVLQGKDKPGYLPHLDTGDVVVVKNAKHVEFTGKKWDQKLYRHHTGFPGGLKERTARDQFQRQPEEILRRAVYGMLPKNRLRDDRARKLRIFPGEAHPFATHPRLVEWEPPPRNVKSGPPPPDIEPGWMLMNPKAYWRQHRLVLSPEQAAIVQQQIREQEEYEGEHGITKNN